MYSDWGKAAQAFIAQLDEQLGERATLEERWRLLRAHASEFHAGTSWGKKVWSRESRKYLERHGQPPKPKLDAKTKADLDKLAKGLASGLFSLGG